MGERRQQIHPRLRCMQMKRPGKSEHEGHEGRSRGHEKDEETGFASQSSLSLCDLIPAFVTFVFASPVTRRRNGIAVPP